MKWHSESYSTKMDRLSKWHTWFAWCPIRIGDEIYWLQTVERRIEGIFLCYWWNYRIPKKEAGVE